MKDRAASGHIHRGVHIAVEANLKISVEDDVSGATQRRKDIWCERPEADAGHGKVGIVRSAEKLGVMCECDVK